MLTLVWKSCFNNFFWNFFFGVKFVSAYIDAFFNKKNGGQIFSPKKDQTGGGVRGGFGKRPDFFRIFFSATFPYVSVSWYHYWKFFSNDDLPLNVCDLDLFAAPSSDEFYMCSVIQ